MKSPAFQFYPNDFLGSAKVGVMSAEEVGAYLLLLCLDWQEGGFVYDEGDLARWCRLPRAKFRKAWVRVSRCFVERDGRMFNPRLDAERTKQADWREKSRKGGIASGEARTKGGSTTLATAVEPKPQPNTNTPFPSPSPTPVTTSSSSSPDVALLLAELPTPAMRLSWASEINGARQGMHGKALTDEQIDRACRDYTGNGHLASPSLRHFRAFLAEAGRPPTQPTRPPTNGTHDPDAHAAWVATIALLPKWQRREITAEHFAEFSPGMRAGLSAVGGFQRIAATPDDKRVWLEKDFAAAFHASPAAAHA